MHRVFLSSTARDLSAYREAVYHAIERLDGFHCVRMEDFGARDAGADEFCRVKIAECDVAVILAGLCYGSHPETSRDSYTVREYQAAKSADIPRLVFLSAEDIFYPGYYRESDERWEKQQAFRARLNRERIRDDFTTPEELAGKVATAVSNWVRDHPERPGASRHTDAKVQGSGAVAQGEGATAAGAGGVAVRGDVHGGIHMHSNSTPDGSESELRHAYLNRILKRRGYLSLVGIDPAVASQPDADAGLSLDAVYTALLTRSPRQEEGNSINAPRALPDPEKRRSALEELDRHQRLVLQGDPGSGKSTFVNFVALCMAGEILKDNKINLARLRAPLPDEEGNDGENPQSWCHEALLPVPVVLRDFAAVGLPERGKTATAQHLWQFIEQGLREADLADFVISLKKELRDRGGLVLLDGLDEVPEAEKRREQVKEAVEDFVQTYGKCRVLVTSRTYAYQNQNWRLQGFDEAVLAPFSKGQIRRFVACWYQHMASLGRLGQQNAAGRAKLLEQAIFNRPTLHDLAQRPLLLTLMASLHAWRSGDLPEKRESLYADAVELLLNRWEQRLIRYDAEKRPVLIQPSLAEYLKVDWARVRGVLEALAYEAHEAQPQLTGTADLSEDTLAGRLLRLSTSPEVNIGRLVEYLRDRAGLLYPRGVGVYTFPHRSFQEYLAACYLTDDEYPDKIAELVRADPDRWREVALLAGAKASRGAAATLWLLAEALCFREPDDFPIEPADEWGAQIAAQALVESADLSWVSPANQKKLDRIRQWLIRLMRSERLSAAERALAGDNLAVLGDPRFNLDCWYLPKEPLLGFIEIPAGEFIMGSDQERDKRPYDDESPQHKVQLPRYYMARWPVTVAQFAAFVEISGYVPDDADSLQGTANHPVTWVTWHDAIVYCQWLGEHLRGLAVDRLAAQKMSSGAEHLFWKGLADGSLGVGLPSEAEWEKAACGNDGRIYPWGEEPDPEKANYIDTGLFGTTAVGCFPRGTSPYGCEDMSGNVLEWTRSLYQGYPYPKEGSERQAREDPAAEGRRVLRGGAFYLDPGVARCAFRFIDVPDFRFIGYGIRVVVSPFFSGR